MKAILRTGTAAAFAAFATLPSEVRAQGSREELYQFRLPIHLTQLSDDLVSVRIECSSSPSPTQPARSIPAFGTEIEIKNNHLDTTVVIQMKTYVPAKDVGQSGVYTCMISAWDDRNAQRTSSGGHIAAPSLLGPDAAQLAFRVAPALSTVSRTFIW